VEDNHTVVAKALPGLRSQDCSTGQQPSTGTLGTLVPESTGATVCAATPSPTQAGAIVPRRRFQKGNIIIRGKTPRRYGMYWKNRPAIHQPAWPSILSQQAQGKSLTPVA
jgi:hypothetical protein